MLSGAVPDSSGRPLAGRGPFGRRKHVGNPPGEVERVLRHGIMNAVEDLSAAAERLAEADGIHDAVPEHAFYLTGGMADVLAAAERTPAREGPSG